MQIVIVFVTVLVLSSNVMARGKKHHKWWKPFSSLWSSIHQLQEEMADDKNDVKSASQNAPVPQVSSVSLISGGESGLLVCPGCMFPKGPLPDNIDIYEMLKGAYMPRVYFLGTDLSGSDLSNAYLRGANIYDSDFSEAVLAGADFSPWVQIFNGGEQEAPTIFSGTNLLNADFTGAEGLEEVQWKNGTTCPDGSYIPNDVNTCWGHLEPRDP